MASVLIIEDDDFVKNMLKQTLERAGYEVATAANGRIGLQLYQAQPFDMIITDLIMPDMEGIETISQLRQHNPAVKVIAISGGGRNSPDDYLYIAQKLGAARAFAKPVNRDQLLNAVAELLC